MFFLSPLKNSNGCGIFLFKFLVAVAPPRPYFPRQPRVCSRNRRLLPSYEPRDANISPVLSTLRMLPVATGVSGPRAFLTPRPSFTQSGFREGSLGTRHCSFVFNSLPPLF